LVTGLLLALTLSASADVYMPGAVEKDRFKAYFTQGEKLYAQGEYGAAIWNFRQADRQLATPEVIYDLAKCHEKLGDVAFATYYYRLYLKRSPNASDALDVAERVGTALSKAEADGRGFLEIEVYAVEQIQVSNRRYAEGPVALFLPPGDYEVTGNFPEGEKKMVAQLRTGKTTNLVFEPVAPPMVDAVQGAPDAAIDTTPQRPSSKRGLRVTSYVIAGLGVAALGVGAALGVINAGQVSQLQTDKSLTPSKQLALANSANTNGLAANILFGAGGALVAGGVVMWIVSIPEPGMKGSGGSQ
jgi:tetratricopeptide (TPR) repeat protein